MAGLHRNVAAALLLAMAAAGGSGLMAPVALAQPVVQALPNPATAELRDALQRLSSNPNSLDDLIAAGRASVALDDLDAAESFFARAREVASGDGRVLAGMALVRLGRQDAPGALTLFDRAAAAGESLDPYAGERGLAYDLVGMNGQAQVLYAMALERENDPQIVRRLALSHAIAGDQTTSEAVLLPLLQAGDHAAYRTRAFTLAINGRVEEAESIIEAMLPARLSRRLSPYLHHLPQLTRAQQAKAANLGVFPQVAEIGQDDPAIAAFAGGQAPAQAPSQAGPDARLVPEGELLGTREPAAPPPAAPSPEVQQTPGAELPPIAPVNEPATEPVIAPVAAAPSEPLPPAQPSAAPAPEPAAMVQPLPAPEPEPAPPPVDLAEIFAEFARSPETMPMISADAVDITRITPAREAPPPAPEPQPEPKPEPEPSRHWVQVATGRDVAAFRWDWRRITRNAGGLLDGREAFHTRWGESNRLVTGPFASEAEAQEFVTALGAQGISSFRFTSAAGEKLTPIP